MKSEVYHKIIFLVCVYQYIHCQITNPAIGILTESNIYLAQIKELNYTNDDYYLIYHHNDPVYQLHSFTSNHFLHRIYICSPNTLYTLDLQVGSTIIPLSPVDDTPCRSSLTYVGGKAVLIWAFRRKLIQLDFEDMSTNTIWNSTSTIIDMAYNNTIDYLQDDFYFCVTRSDRQSGILHCRADNRAHSTSFQSCQFIDNGYQEATALALYHNNLYVADRLQQKIVVLTLSPSGLIVKKYTLPLNRSVVADIESLFVYDQHLFWLTITGHVRSVSLITYEVRNIFWFDEPLKSIRLVSFSNWPNQTIPTEKTTQTSRISTITHHTPTKETKITTSTSANETIDTTTIQDNYTGTWKATTYVTSVILGVALFLCAAMITCVLLNYRLGRVVPHSFTNVFHILRSRTTVSTVHAEDESMT